MFYTLRSPGRRMSLVIATLDDFTGKFVSGRHINVSIDGPFPPPIVKPDGYYVFFDLPPGTYTVHIRSNRYFPERMTLCPKETPYIVRMIPDRRYPVPKGTTVIEGTLTPGSEVYLTPQGRPGHKLLRAAEDQITLLTSLPWDLTNRIVSIGESRERREITEQMDAYTYRISAPLPSEYEKCPVFPVSTGRTDSEGGFFCPLGLLLPEQKEVLIECRGFNPIRQKIVYGQVNRCP